MSKLDIKDGIDNIIYRSYNAISELIFTFKFSTKKILAKNDIYLNVHEGEECFILGTGPSLNNLKNSEIDALRNEIIIGVNSLYKSKIGDQLVPRYYALMDNLYWESWNYTFNDISSKYINNPPTFITDIRAKHLIDVLKVKNSAIYLYSKKYPANRMTDEIDKNIYATMNVVSFSILVAMYMGFKKIYLLGCDFNAFCKAGKGHCYDDKSEISQSNYNLAFYLKHYLMITEFHYLIAELARKKHIEIINLTDGSLLDAYPMQHLSQVLK